MDNVLVSDVFASYQGEGFYVGEKHIFVRFSLCNLNCSYCDEPASRLKGKEIDIKKLANQIKRLSAKNSTNTISFTGGEPLLYYRQIKELISILGKKYRYLLETNGTLYENLKEIINLIDIISMDIKLPQYCGKKLWKEHYKFLKISKDKVYVKVVVGKDIKLKDFKKAVLLVSKICNKIPFFIQPDSSEMNNIDIKFIDRLYKIAKRYLYNVRYLPQLHKLLNIK